MDLNSNFGALLDEYCKKVKYSKNYTAKIFDFIKTVWIYSRDCGFSVSNDFNKVKFSEEPTDSIYLNTDELRRIQNCNLLHSNLDDVRDWLMIGCYTGARVSDLLNLTMQDITEQYDRDSNRHIRVLSFIQKKTKNRKTYLSTPKKTTLKKKSVPTYPRKKYPTYHCATLAGFLMLIVRSIRRILCIRWIENH
jgi:integrase